MKDIFMTIIAYGIFPMALLYILAAGVIALLYFKIHKSVDESIKKVSFGELISNPFLNNKIKSKYILNVFFPEPLCWRDFPIEMKEMVERYNWFRRIVWFFYFYLSFFFGMVIAHTK